MPANRNRWRALSAASGAAAGDHVYGGIWIGGKMGVRQPADTFVAGIFAERMDEHERAVAASGASGRSRARDASGGAGATRREALRSGIPDVHARRAGGVVS